VNSKIIFDYLRKLSGGVLTQAQVIATDKLLSIDLDSVKNMLGVPESMSVSNKGVDLICEFEGKRLVAYDDGVGVWTIGFGTIKYPSGNRVKKGDTCTLEQAKEYMRHDLIEFEHTVNSSVKVPLNQNQFDALVSLAYNIGSSAFKSSTLVKKLNAGDYKGAADQFNVWINAGGKRMQGLVNRRDREKLLFLS
jgi:lysozyme